MESAIKLAGRFIAGLSRHSSATADVTKPARPAAGASPARPPQPSTLNPQRSTLNHSSSGRTGQTSPAPVGDFFCSRTAAWLFQPEPLPKRVRFLRRIS
jgi:hypothetical protein